MNSVDWAALRLVSCDDALVRIRTALPGAIVQAQRDAIERGWLFSVELDGQVYSAGLSDAQIEEASHVAAMIGSLLRLVSQGKTETYSDVLDLANKAEQGDADTFRAVHELAASVRGAQ